MSIEQIRESLENTSRFLRENPDKGRGTPPGASAAIESGLRCKIEGPNGLILYTDMPEMLGGAATAPSPGWYMRAAHAACDATGIAMRAAREGISLTRLEVTVDNELDNRGMLGEGESIPPGPLSTKMVVRISAPDADPEKLREIVEWAEAHSPVGDALCRAVPGMFEVEIV